MPQLDFDAATEAVRTDTSDPFAFNHTPTGTPRAIVLTAVHGTSSTDHIVGVTYGGVAMTRAKRNVDTSTEPGASEIWFLGAAIPTGLQSVSIDFSSGTTDDFHFVCLSYVANADTEVVDSDGVSENVANPSVTLQYAARRCASVAALYGGGADGGSFTPNANCTTVHDHDLGAFYSEVIRQTTPGTVDFAIGGTSGSDDVAYAAIAFSEIASPRQASRAAPEDIGQFSRTFSEAEGGWIRSAGAAVPVVPAVAARALPSPFFFDHRYIFDQVGFQHSAILEVPAASPQAPRVEFPTDLAFYAHPPSEAQGGWQKSVKLPDAIRSAREFPVDLSLYRPVPTRDEIGFERRPVGPNEPAIAQRSLPDPWWFQKPTTEAEIGWTRSVAADPLIPRQASRAAPDDLSLFQHRPIEDQFTWTRGSKQADPRQASRVAPDDLSEYLPRPVEAQLSWQRSPLAPNVDPRQASRIAPDDVAQFAQLPAEAQYSWARSSIVLVPSPRQGSRVAPEDVRLFANLPLEAQYLWIRSGFLFDARQASRVAPEDLAPFAQPTISDQFSQTRAPAPASITWTTYGFPFLYTRSEWDTLSKFHLECYMRAITTSFEARLFNMTDGTAVPSSQIQATLTSLRRIRSGPFPLIDGKEYAVQFGIQPGRSGAFKMGRVVTT
jgi:hypothetical protein